MIKLLRKGCSSWSYSSNKMDIFAANERGPNFLYLNKKNQFYNVSTEYNTDDVLQMEEELPC